MKLMALTLLTLFVSSPAFAQDVFVNATVETAPIPTAGDGADDPAIWVHPTNPNLSLILGSNKQVGVGVYDLQGNERQYLRDGAKDSIDVRYGFPFEGGLIDIAAAGNSKKNINGVKNRLMIYKINPQTRQLEDISAGTISKIEVYGSCLYRDPQKNSFYLFVDSRTGEVEQWELYDNDNGNGKVAGRLVRTMNVGGRVEGCVADDELSNFYIGEERGGVWKYSAKENGGNNKIKIAKLKTDGGQLVGDIEGLALYHKSNGTGYLMVSSQGNHRFMIYEREGANKYIGAFGIQASAEIDEVTQTDGIEVISTPLGTAFPFGVFVAQDNENTGSQPNLNQNFKLVPFENIANAFGDKVTWDTQWNPRGSANVPPPDLVPPDPPIDLRVIN